MWAKYATSKRAWLTNLEGELLVEELLLSSYYHRMLKAVGQHVGLRQKHTAFHIMTAV